MSSTDARAIRITDTAAITGTFRPLFQQEASATSTDLKSTAQQDRPSDESDFARGYAEGEAATTAAFAEERDALQTLIFNLENLQTEPSEELALLIGKTVEGLVRQIVGDFTPDAEWLEGRIEKAAKLISKCDAARTIWMHPEDVALLDKNRSPLDFVADETAQRGSVRIECSRGWIESENALYLEELCAELGLNGGAA